MSRKKSQKKAGVLEPVYALLGATEMATGALRRLGASEETDETTARPMLARLKGDVTDIARGTTRVPGLAVEEARARYSAFAERGQQTVAGVIPVVDKARRDGTQAARAEEAKARREARRLARQAGETVSRGRAFATQAAGDAGKTAERTLEAVRAEAGQVVEAVTHPGRITSRPLRTSVVRRRAAVTDTAVTSTSPVGGEVDTKTDVVGAGGVEAAAATIGRRSPRARRVVDEAEKAARKSVSRRTPTTSTTTDATTVVAKKAKSKAAAPADAVSEKVWTSETPTSDAAQAPEATPATPEKQATPAPEKQQTQTTPEKQETSAAPQPESTAPKHSDIPTPADVAKTVESSHHDG